MSGRGRLGVSWYPVGGQRRYIRDIVVVRVLVFVFLGAREERLASAGLAGLFIGGRREHGGDARLWGEGPACQVDGWDVRVASAQGARVLLCRGHSARLSFVVARCAAMIGMRRRIDVPMPHFRLPLVTLRATLLLFHFPAAACIFPCRRCFSNQASADPRPSVRQAGSAVARGSCVICTGR